MKQFTIPSVFTAIDKITQPVKAMARGVSAFINRTQEQIARFERTYRELGRTATQVSKKAFIVGAAIAAPLIVAARDAIIFEDRMADVAKTTGLAGKQLNKFGGELLALAPGTRTSIEELQTIAVIGGQMHVANNELLGFTDSVNKFNVALGSDFAGGVEGATKAISGLKVLFKQTRDLDISAAITKTGSAINALSAQGVVVPEITEFVSRVGQLPDAIKPSIQDTIALAGVFNKAGITAEIASRAFGDVLITASNNLPRFAKQMGMTEKALASLINKDPAAFVLKFSESLKGMDATKLAKSLKGMKLTDAGAIKLVGALGSSTEMLGQFQGIANKEFAKGTSLLEEYNTKNNTTRANISKAINNFKALSITIGTELLPMINDVIRAVAPLFASFIQFAKDNPGTVKTMLGLAIAFSALSFIVSGVAGAIALYSNIMLIASKMTKIVTVAQWLWNAAMTANPIGIIIVAIAALAAWIAMIITKWDEWGASMAIFLGPLGLIVSMIMSFRRNWDMVVKAFKEGSVLDGLIAIGKVLLDAVLMPLQQIIELIASVTGADWAAAAAKNIESFRAELGLNVEKPTNPKATEQEALAQTIETSQSQNVAIQIEDKTGRASMQSDNNLVPITMNSTRPAMGF